MYHLVTPDARLQQVLQEIRDANSSVLGGDGDGVAGGDGGGGGGGGGGRPEEGGNDRGSGNPFSAMAATKIKQRSRRLSRD